MTTLARLSFQIKADQLNPFARDYERQLAPILKRHGLVPATEKGRPTAEGVFSRFFAVDSPAAIVDYQQRLGRDATWQQALQHLVGSVSR